MSFFSRSRGVLGMNARNLLYVSRYNSKVDKRFADDKIYTKQFLSSRGIGVARIFHIIKNYQELRALTQAQLPQSFVIKPNHGFAGEGIIVISERRKNGFLDASGSLLSWDDLVQNMIAILEGKYAISGLRDTVLIEETLEPHEYFRPFVAFGLPDIRIIVFNLVPVVAMLRLPTAASRGKANLHLGAIGLGIDLGTGKTTYGVLNNTFITRLPNGKRVNELALPEWKLILQTATLCQKISGIGYLAVDIALTARGVKVLELNARAGLSVQIANRVFLKSRLEKIADLKVPSPEKGVEIAQTLFAGQTTLAASGQPNIIGTTERIRILEAAPETCVAKIDPHAETTIIDETISITGDEKIINVIIGGTRLKIPYEKASLPPNEGYKVILAGKYLKGFLIDPARAATSANAHIESMRRKESMMKNLDKKLMHIATHINLLSQVRPVNVEKQRMLFLENPSVSPHFTYRPIMLDIDQIRRKLSGLPADIDHPLTPLYSSKIHEINKQLDLIQARGTTAFSERSIDLFGSVNQEAFAHALEYLSTNQVLADPSQLLTTKQVKDTIEKFLAKRHISGWSIAIVEESVADMHINKKGSIMIRKGAAISEYRLRTLLAHEIETHVYRRDNGRAQVYRLFEYGTAQYLETEEGLAIFNQEQLHLPVGSKSLRFAWYIIAIHFAAQVGFAELFSILTDRFHIPADDAVLLCIKVKRGFSDTDQPGAFTKDRLYFSGYQKIRALYADQGTKAIKDLYQGKIAIHDLPLLASLDLTPARHLPSWINS